MRINPYDKTRITLTNGEISALYFWCMPAMSQFRAGSKVEDLFSALYKLEKARGKSPGFSGYGIFTKNKAWNLIKQYKEWRKEQKP